MSWSRVHAVVVVSDLECHELQALLEAQPARGQCLAKFRDVAISRASTPSTVSPVACERKCRGPGLSRSTQLYFIRAPAVSVNSGHQRRRFAFPFSM
jgi:hypothetical protein